MSVALRPHSVAMAVYIHLNHTLRRALHLSISVMMRCGQQARVRCT